MIGVFVTFIRAVYGTMIYMSVPLPAMASGIDIVQVQAPGLVAPKCHLAETIRPIFRSHFLGHFVPAFENGLEFIDAVLKCRFFHAEGHIKSTCC